MSKRSAELAEQLTRRFGERVVLVPSRIGEVTAEVAPADLLDVARVLQAEADFAFEILVDLCGVDYLAFGQGEWETSEATNSGFSRAAIRETIVPDPDEAFDPRRFAVVYHLLSVSRNQRLRLRVFTGAGNPAVVPSVTGVWRSADWYEREAFDLFGILFDGHPDLRRLLTDYGFQGHPLRKDFPVTGYVEIRYDDQQKRVIYEPVRLTQEFRNFDFESPWEGTTYVLPGDEKAAKQ